MKKVLFVAGGWDGHKPREFAGIFAEKLASHGFESDIELSLSVLEDLPRLKSYDLFFPCWTMGSLSEAQGKNLQAAVREGLALGGIHGGMGDAFRGNLDYEWMVGGHFVGHPHVGDYGVRIKDPASPITRDLPASFPYRSEQYYLLVDPGVHVLAETDYSYEGKTCVMPVAWTRMWGKGRVFYSALGHKTEELAEFPHSLTLALRGLLWAADAL